MAFTTSQLKTKLSTLILTEDVRKMFRDIIDSAAVRGEDATLGNIVVDGLQLTDTYYDDLRFPATGINPPGAASDPDRDTTDGTLLFDAASTEIIVGVAQLPHSYKYGTNITAHIHWCPTNTNTGNVYWRFEYELQEIGGIFTGFTTANTLEVADGVAEKHQIHGLATIDGSAVDSVSAIIKWKLSRIGGDATDTYNADARLLELDFHYQIDGFGSDDEYTKSF
jgi:hypothetical protein